MVGVTRLELLRGPIQNIVVSLGQGITLVILLVLSLLALPSSPFRRGRARRPWPRTSWFGTHKKSQGTDLPFRPTKKRRLMPSFLLVGGSRLELLRGPIQNIVVSLGQGVTLVILLVFSLLALPSSPFRRGRARRPWPLAR